MNFIISASTDVGNVKPTNQDSLCVEVLTDGTSRVVFAVLCDGMGGLAKGEVASASVIDAFKKWADTRLPEVYARGLKDADIRQEWTDLAVSCNERIKLYGKKSAVNLGTTLTAMLLSESRYYIINVGDSRAYEIKDECRVLTNDQTVVAREVALGRLTPEQAETDSRRSVLLQCIGASDHVYPDLFFGDLKKDAVYMLCSDGFRHEISADEILAHFHPSQMYSEETMKQSELLLIDMDKRRHERDNISVITVRTF